MLAELEARAAAEAAIQRVMPYPRGRWRLASAQELERVAIWFSHILIRYEDVIDTRVSFDVLGWETGEQPVHRSRDEALALAQRVAHEAASGTATFEQLAANYSEDSTNAERGGTLGGVSGLALTLWPQIGDALAVLQPGQTSMVIETPYGFHILKRNPPPPEQAVSATHILIGYDSAPFFRGLQLIPEAPHRTRAEAAELARDVYQRARRDPSAFPALVARYSEHRDASLQGDWGQWSTREAQAPARELERVAQLAVGEISAPIDTASGYQILMRTPNRERAEYAHQAIEVLYDPRATAGGPDSEGAARERAQGVAAQLAADPSRFDALRTELCCTETHVWRDGREDPALGVALADMAIGQVRTTPVQKLGAFAFLRRLDPRSVPPAQTRLELPNDVRPNVDTFLRQELDSRLATWVVRTLGDAGAELELDAAARDALKRLHETPPEIVAGGERSQWLGAIDGGVKQLLSPDQYGRYRALAARLVEQAVLDPPRLM